MAAQESSGPIKTTNTKKSNTHWWNEDRQAAMEESDNAFNKAKRKPTIENLVEFKKLRAKFRRKMKKSKRQSWQTYFSTITNKTPTKTIWNKIRNINGITQHRNSVSSPRRR